MPRATPPRVRIPKRHPSRYHGKPSVQNAASFWDREYKSKEHFALSDEASEDLKKFVRWCDRHYTEGWIGPHTVTVDAGCGNGRNLIWLAEERHVSGLGYDISREAIDQANARIKGTELPISFSVRPLAQPIPAEDSSIDLVLDMMASHVLEKDERDSFLTEVVRVLRPGGLLYLKTFLLDEDRHAARMLRDNPADEEGSYIHPRLGILEHAATEAELRDRYFPFFELEKIERSGKHLLNGQANKRRFAVLILRKRDLI